MAKYFIKSEDTICFGKHKGEIAEEAVREDPSYFEWAVDDGIIELDNKLYPIYEDALEEYNFNKP